MKERHNILFFNKLFIEQLEIKFFNIYFGHPGDSSPGYPLPFFIIINV